MAVSPQFRDLVVDLLAPLGAVETRRMFGGLSVRCDGLHFAMIVNDMLYLTCDETLRARLHGLGGANFSYAKRDKVVEAPRLVSVPDEQLDDPDAVLALARASLTFAYGEKVEQNKSSGVS